MHKTLLEVLYDMRAAMRMACNFYYFILLLLFLLILINSNISNALAGVIIGLALLMPVYLWRRKGTYGLPFLFVYCTMCSVWYYIPIALRNKSIQVYSDEALLNENGTIYEEKWQTICTFSPPEIDRH